MDARSTCAALARVALATFLITPVACSDDPAGPGSDVPAGTYVAEGAFGALTFTTTDAGSGATTDQLARGASIVLVLHADGATSGRLFVPGGSEEGIDESLAGTWTADRDRVSLDHEADTFLRDMTLISNAGSLAGSRDFNGTTVSVSLALR